MRMKNRYCRMGKTLLRAMCLLSICGFTYSCTDDYDLDETRPSFLGESIYDELKATGKFTNVVRLIDDLEYANVLSKTGSKTLFVADDDAYNRFFQNNTWGVSSYDQLTPAMKRVLLNGSMLNNAYVMEMLSNTEGGGKNLCLRQVSASTALDTIPYWDALSLPYNMSGLDESGMPLPEGEVENVDTKFWNKFRERGAGTGIYMALDKTQPMLTHFLEGQLRDKNITNEDIAFIMNEETAWKENRSYIYGNRVLQQDVTCLNGYYHVLDSVLVTPPNMAEVLRQNGTDEAYAKDKNLSTKYFSLLLDRFSAPYYDANLTQQYKALYDIPADSVYQKRYLANFSQGSKISVDPDGKPLGDFPYLGFDPGWNELASSETLPKEQDMSAIFAPSDQAFENYFIGGAGTIFMERYAKAKPVTTANLAYNLYQIPLDIVQALLRNLMKDSFNESVPSKYLTIMNDAQDQMFNVYTSVDEYKSKINKCLLANNGVIYIFDGVTAPADYAAVVAPVLYSKNTQIMKTVVRADDNFIDGNAYNNAPLQKYFSTYLKAMQSRFSFFVPTDEGLGKYGYVDPYSYAKTPSELSANRRYMKFTYDNNTGSEGKKVAVSMQAYQFSDFTGVTDGDKTLGTNFRSRGNDLLTTQWGMVKKNLLVEMVDQHIVVHDNDDVEGVNGDRQYFLSRSGAPVFVKTKVDPSTKGVGMQVEGGYQLMLENDAEAANDHVCTVTEGYNQTRELPANNNYGNGMTYFLDRPMQPTMKTVYNHLINHPEFSTFFQLCAALDDNGDPLTIADMVEAAGLKTDSMDETDWNNEINKYTIFTDADNYIAPENEYLVRFFNNYRYTVFVPTNEAIQKAIDEKGLPTWVSIQKFINDWKGHVCKDCSEDVKLEANELCEHKQVEVQAMLTMLVNFLKYHFQDESLFVDNLTATERYQTSCIDHEANAYLFLTVDQKPGQMSVTDEAGNTYNVSSNPEMQNILAREMNYSMKPQSILVPASQGYVKVSSYVTLHQLEDGVLNFDKNFAGRYDGQWNTPAKARKFVAKYKLRK